MGSDSGSGSPFPVRSDPSVYQWVAVHWGRLERRRAVQECRTSRRLEMEKFPAFRVAALAQAVLAERGSDLSQVEPAFDLARFRDPLAIAKPERSDHWTPAARRRWAVAGERGWTGHWWTVRPAQPATRLQ